MLVVYIFINMGLVDNNALIINYIFLVTSVKAAVILYRDAAKIYILFISCV